MDVSLCTCADQCNQTFVIVSDKENTRQLDWTGPDVPAFMLVVIFCIQPTSASRDGAEKSMENKVEIEVQ